MYEEKIRSILLLFEMILNKRNNIRLYDSSLPDPCAEALFCYIDPRTGKEMWKIMNIINGDENVVEKKELFVGFCNLIFYHNFYIADTISCNSDILLIIKRYEIIKRTLSEENLLIYDLYHELEEAYHEDIKKSCSYDNRHISFDK